MTIKAPPPFVPIMNTNAMRVMGGVLAAGLSLLVGGCDLPPPESEAFAAKTLAPDAGPPCPDARRIVVHDAAWRCDPSGSWHLVAREEWACTDAERRMFVRVHRTRMACAREPRTP